MSNDPGRGVSAPAEKDQSALPAVKEPLTEDKVAEMIETARAAIKAEYEGPGGHLAQVRSQYARTLNEREQTWDGQRQQFEDALHQSNTKGLSDQDRAVYERDLYKERSSLLLDQVQQTRADLAAARQMGNYVRGLQESFGVDVKDLDLESVDRLSETAFTAAANAHQNTLAELKAAQDKIATLELRTTGNASPEGTEAASGAIEAPAVTTVIGGTKTSPITIMDLRRSLSVGRNTLISEEELFELAENPEETGVDLNVVLESLRAELEGLEEAI
jgi:hypothetical protein